MAIWLPQMGGGKKIRDADALPEDVRLGRVFYNNEGRQVGTLGSVQSCIVYKNPDSNSEKNLAVKGHVSYEFAKGGKEGACRAYDTINLYYHQSMLLEYDEIVSIEVDGIERELGIGKSGTAAVIGVRDEQNLTGIEIIFFNGEVYTRFMRNFVDLYKINYIKY